MKAEKFEVNDIIRAYDFKPMFGRPDCFVEGRIVERTSQHGYDAYKIHVLVDEFDGKRFEECGYGCRVGHSVLVPVEVFHNDYPGRVINLSRV
jgi:hypothetical protein